MTVLKPESQRIIPFYGKKKYSNQSEELMTPFKSFHPAKGWEDEKNVQSICGPAWTRKRLKHSFFDLTTD